ncbi:MAG: SMC family ATPase [Verrucomicrobiota bacterium]
MRLLSATVRRYRIHDETTVEFADSLNLIGGPNESGKSTLAEAIHRALFLKATIGGEVRSGMLSDRTPGHPEVDVRFEAAGKIWRIQKTFSGGSGKAILSEEGGPTLHDSEAESQLADLLQVEEIGGGRGVANRIASQWAHLWVWQGRGGDDPAAHATDQRDALLSRLQEEGGGAAMQSENDSRVAGEIGDRYAQYFTAGGKVKAGSLLQQAKESLERAETSFQGAKSAFSQLEEAHENFIDADVQLTSLNSSSEQIALQLATARAKQTKVSALRVVESKHEAYWKQAQSRHAEMASTLSRIQQLEREIELLFEASKTTKQEEQSLASSLSEARRRLAAAEAESEQADHALTTLRNRRDWIDAVLRQLRLKEELATLNASRKEAEKHKNSSRKIEAELAELPPIDEEAFREIQQLQADLSEAEAVLSAMATEVEVIQSAGKVKIDDRELEAGDSHIVDSETEIDSGNGLRLKITPGGGADLSSQRQHVSELRLKRENLFQSLGVKALNEAQSIAEKRRLLETKQNEFANQLATRDLGQILSQIEALEDALIAADAELNRRRALQKDVSDVTTIRQAESLRNEVEEELNPLETSAEGRKQARSDLAERVRQVENQMEAARGQTRKAENNLNAAQGEAKAIGEPLGRKEDRASDLARLSEATKEAEASYRNTLEALRELQPESIEADVARLERALENTRREISSAEGLRAVAGNTLMTSGSIDPSASLETAQARLQVSAERHSRIQRQAQAIALLHQYFGEEQQKLSDHFSRPLADKVSDYLKQIFGPSAEASVTLQDQAFTGWGMARDGTAFDFTSLSGGTREQVAAGVRLAMAELLAENHGGSLPIIFDDAFTHSDPERVFSLQRMLDLAARRGLQVIVLTSDPAAYSALGAHRIALSRKAN